MSENNKPVIKNVDMVDDMQREALECANQALEKYNIEKDIAAHIKREFDKKYGTTWHCIDFSIPPKSFEDLNNAYTSGDYTTAIKFLTSLSTNVSDQNTKRYEAREHVFLSRAVCFQQMREHQQVVSDTTEVVKIVKNVTSTSSLSLDVISVNSEDCSFCLILALWLRSLAFESLENWDRAKDDLDTLKTLIFEKNRDNMIPYKTEGVLSVFLPHMTPLITQSKFNTIKINIHCVNDRQRRMNDLVAKEAARRNDGHKAFRLIDRDVGCLDEIAKKFHYRLLLRRPLHPNIHMNMWYTLDLMFVSEVGLFRKEDLYGVQGYALGCKLLEIGNIDEGSEKEKYEVQVRPMSAESREWSDCTDADWAGVQNGGKGGLEFRIVKSKKLIETNGCKEFNIFNCSAAESNILSKSEDSNGNSSVKLWRKNSSKTSRRQLYLYVYPIQEVLNYDTKDDSVKDDNKVNGNNKELNRCVHENYLVPLSIGPIRLVTCEAYSNSCVHHLPPSGSNENNDNAIQSNNPWNSQQITTSVTPRKKSPWNIDDYLVDSYRGFVLPNGKYLIIKELWDAGIPGKVWDSAFIIVQMIKDKILKDQNFFTGKRILDLSAGTGFVGLYLAAFLATGKSEEIMSNNLTTNIVITDLEHALKLIRGNLALNQYILDSSNKVKIDVEVLQWGDLPRIRKLEILDYVFASDVVYEPESFDSLIQTFIAVCTPGLTKIYLGYKRRGLNKDEEGRFFDKLKTVFQMSSVQGLGILAEEGKVNVYELIRK
ncbi:19171_t:CDS:2 [Funneliformis geosporum]|uniref:Dynein light chain 1, cytoplasmic n=1 Tax=Funneliformis geosporum TaxID=1117311 RepID=A0A9W4WHW9_9GLOM|nr:19171_t:CDS:2 [Funneliformis geosporum]